MARRRPQRPRDPSQLGKLIPHPKTLRITPAMAAGVTDKLWSMADLAEMVDLAQPKPGERGPYKQHAASA
jgi:hypothetical protein